MTIPNVSAGQTVDPAWGNAVADQLNDLPDGFQHGRVAGTTTGNATLTITFPRAFAADPDVVATAIRTSNTAQATAHVFSVSTTQAVLVFTTNDSPDNGVSRSAFWMAAGPIA